MVNIFLFNKQISESVTFNGLILFYPEYTAYFLASPLPWVAPFFLMLGRIQKRTFMEPNLWVYPLFCSCSSQINSKKWNYWNSSYLFLGFLVNIV